MGAADERVRLCKHVTPVRVQICSEKQGSKKQRYARLIPVEQESKEEGEMARTKVTEYKPE
jgi:hypothetical protein